MITFITGASSNHYKTLIQFLNSFYQYKKDDYRMIVYNLELTNDEHENLKSLFPWAIIRIFDYSKYPPYFDINIEAGQYAWKPVIINSVCREFEGYIIWLDAGTYVLGPLDKFVTTVEVCYIYTPRSPGTIREWTHPQTIDFYNNREFDLNAGMRAGGVLGVNCVVGWVREFLDEWEHAALNKDILAPPGSSRINHRQDQSVISILYDIYLKKHKFERIDEFINFDVQRDIG